MRKALPKPVRPEQAGSSCSGDSRSVNHCLGARYECRPRLWGERIKILVSNETFLVDEESTLLMAQAHGCRCHLQFCFGYVRDFNETSTVQAIFLEHTGND